MDLGQINSHFYGLVSIFCLDYNLRHGRCRHPWKGIYMVDVNGRIVKRFRKEAKMTQEQLCHVAGIGLTTLKKIEATRGAECYDLSQAPAKKLARALDVSVKSLSDEKAYRIGSSTNDLNYELIALRYGVTQEWVTSHLVV